MIKKRDPTGSKPPANPVPDPKANEAREAAESLEVLGRHKNDGPKDHKGAR